MFYILIEEDTRELYLGKIFLLKFVGSDRMAIKDLDRGAGP